MKITGEVSLCFNNSDRNPGFQSFRLSVTSVFSALEYLLMKSISDRVHYISQMHFTSCYSHYVLATSLTLFSVQHKLTVANVKVIWCITILSQRANVFQAFEKADQLRYKVLYGMAILSPLQLIRGASKESVIQSLQYLDLSNLDICKFPQIHAQLHFQLIARCSYALCTL